jgi:ribosomal protein S18 acetylase RimI-like enzyme
MTDTVTVVEADLGRKDHQEAVLAMTDAYSRDAFGDGKPLDPGVRERLIPGLRSHPTTLVMLAFECDRAIGAATCFVGFSTFAAKPLINIHDLVVATGCRGRGVGRRLLEAVEQKARALGCCKITLEVLDRNERALGAYKAFGFAQYELQEGAGQAIFMTKALIRDAPGLPGARSDTQNG